MHDDLKNQKLSCINQLLWIIVIEIFNSKILYINSVSLSVCPGRYILNPCEQGVVFVFNVAFWTCLSVWTKLGQCLEDSSSCCPFPVEHLVMIFIFFVEGGRGWGWGSRGLNRWKWERTHCNQGPVVGPYLHIVVVVTIYPLAHR